MRVKLTRGQLVVQVFSPQTPRAVWPLSTENSGIRLVPEWPTLPDPQGSDSAAPPPRPPAASFSVPPGHRGGGSCPSPNPLPGNCGPTPPNDRREDRAAHEGRRPGLGAYGL